VTESSGDDAAAPLRPIFGAAWKAAGWPRSLQHDEQGRRKNVSDSLMMFCAVSYVKTFL
jgi:hypothetical protein